MSPSESNDDAADSSPATSASSGCDGDVQTPLSANATTTTSPSAPPVKVRRRPIPRKGHTKSRKGCYNCKRRKVKCQENLPRCAQCQRLNLQCEYPAASLKVVGSPPPPMSTAPPTFTLDDLRFLNHFMEVAHPPLPLGRSDIWRRIGAFCHNYDHLAHALLGTAASHLSHHTDTDYTVQALSHRVKAINLVQDKLLEPCPTKDDVDALFGTLMLLTDQAFYMRDAMVEFVTLCRGCELMGSQVPNYSESSFNCFTVESHVGKMMGLIRSKSERLNDERLIDGILESARRLAPLCKTDFERAYLEALEKTVNTAISSSADAWLNFMALYMSPSRMSHQEFAQFTSRDNHIGQLLLIHMFSLDHLLGQFIFVSHHHGLRARKRVLIDWVGSVAKRLPPEYDQYIQWPREFARSLLHETDCGLDVLDIKKLEGRLISASDLRLSESPDINIAEIKAEPV